MKKLFYSGPEIEIGKDYLKIKKRNTRINFRDINSVSIKNARIDRAWLLYAISGIAGLAIILCLLVLVIRDLYGDSSGLAGSGLFVRKRTIIPLMLLFIGGPFFILMKIKKYFRKYLVLIIRWDHHDFRIRISGLKINAYKLKSFFEGKIRSVESDIQEVTGKTLR